MSTIGSSAAKHAYRPDLDGLRAIAILSVVLHHAGAPWLAGGFTGVDIFFVLSGYLIGGQIYAELRTGSFSFLRFYQRRARRILPAFFVVLAFTLLAGMVLLSPVEFANLARSSFTATASVSNIFFWGTTNYFAARSNLDPMLMTWSLGVEEQFYAVIPLLLVLLARVRRQWILPAVVAVCAASFVLAWAALGQYPMAAFYLLPPRAWELGAGVALAVIEANRQHLPTRGGMAQIAAGFGLASMISPMFLLHAATPFPGPAALPSALGAAMSIAAAESWINRRVLSVQPLVFIGRISYSLYLWHWPLLAFHRIVCGSKPSPAMATLAVVVAFVAAVASYRWIEQPFRRSRGAPVPLLLRAAAASAAALAVCAVVWFTGGLPQRFPALAGMESANRALHSDPCLAGYGRDAPNATAKCDEAIDTQPAIALWGDSHAAALAPGLRLAAHERGYGFAQFTKASCAPLAGATHFVPRIPRLAGECARFNQDTLKLLRTQANIHVVLLASEWAGYLYGNWQDGWLTVAAATKTPPTPNDIEALFAASMAATIRELEADGRQVLVLDDVPSFEVDPLWRVRTAMIPARRQLALGLGATQTPDPGNASPAHDPHAELASVLLRKAAAGSTGATIIDMRPAFCLSGESCAYRQGSTLLYVDGNHLSTAGATLATSRVAIPPLLVADRRSARP